MTRQLAPDRMALPPPISSVSGVSAAHRVARAPSATAFVARVILAAVAIVMAATLVANAPQTVLIPLAVVLVGGLVASGIVVINERMLADRRPARRSGRSIRRYSQPRSAPFDTTNTQPGARGSRDQRRAGARRGVTGVATLGAVSLTFLVLALVAPAGFEIALVTGGLLGLAVVRLTAMPRVWASHGAAPPRRAHRPSAPGDANGHVARREDGELVRAGGTR